MYFPKYSGFALNFSFLKKRGEGRSPLLPKEKLG